MPLLAELKPRYVVAQSLFPSTVLAAYVCLDVPTCSDPRGAWVSRSSYECDVQKKCDAVKLCDCLADVKFSISS